MKKWVALAVFATLLLAATPVFAKGPAEKATGKFGIDERGWYAEFNAHEATDGRPEKGSMRMWRDEVIPPRELHLEVSNVNVFGNEAEFEALCTYDSWGISHPNYRVGITLYVKVKDNGEPGINNDEIGWLWSKPPDTYSKGTIIDGNLQVHSDWVLFDTIKVYAINSVPTYSNISLETGVQYELVAMGTAFAGDTIDFDAKYSITNRILGDTWTDTVTGYESYGPTLLDLFVDGDSVDWGAYNTFHKYYLNFTGTGATVELLIDDIWYPNNTGSIIVNIYRLP